MANETNVPTPKPTTLEGWVKLLDGVRLPVPQASHDLVCRAINDDRRSLRDIADLMQDSPASGRQCHAANGDHRGWPCTHGHGWLAERAGEHHREA